MAFIDGIRGYQYLLTIREPGNIPYQIADFGYRLAGMPSPDAPKHGAIFHFSLPGSVQGFEADSRKGTPSALKVEIEGQVSSCRGNESCEST